MLFQKEKTLQKVLSLPVAEIRPNPSQPRKHFDRAELESLSASIKENGLLQPITVCRAPEGGYHLIAGERRLCATKMTGAREIAAILLDADPDRSATLALLENLQRSDLNCFEEAEAMSALLARQQLTQEQLARQLGLAQCTVANKLRLLRLAAPARDALLAAGLGERHARALLALPAEAQLPMAQTAARNGWSAGELEKQVRAALTAPAPAQKKSPRPKWARDAKLFVNTVDKTVGMIRRMGFAVEAAHREENDYLEYTIRFPLQRG